MTRVRQSRSSKIRIGIIQTFEPGERWTYELGFALERLGFSWVPIEATYLKAVVNERGSASLLIEGDPDLSESSVDELALDGVIWRVSEEDFYNYSNIFALLSARYVMINDWQCIRTCSDKWRTSVKLAAAGITVVPTVLLAPGMAVPGFEGRKTIIKPSVGASGNGVRLADSGVIPSISTPHVAQPLVEGPSSAHIRVIVCGFEPIVSIHRIPGANQKSIGVEINNVAAGGRPVPAPMEPVHDLAAQVARCVGGDVIGVDFVPWNGGYAVLEVNSSPGFNGIDEATGVDCFQAAAEQVVRRLSGTAIERKYDAVASGQS
ncbi:RimK family alpha-L-glutamate ligase [Streptomyces sp. NPDC050564]|uniref:RimK family alpha-L-glutamate ligase n=1 Tax=Streptomyces sp. NPDC050564 TaxID=3365631 RepID=UPI00379DC0C6